MHGDVRTLVTPVFLECGDEIFGMLTGQLRHAVIGVGVAIAVHTVAAQAGVRDGLAMHRIGLLDRQLGESGRAGQRHACGKNRYHARTDPTAHTRHHLAQNGSES